MTRPPCRLAVAVVALLLVACATPQSRIDRDPDAFQALDAGQQALVRAGRIAIGFPEAAVRLALGEPDRISRRTDEHGETTVWRYVERDGGGAVSLGYGYGGWGRPIGLYGPGWYGPGVTTVITSGGRADEHDRLRVSFVAGKVSAIEEEVD